jgi:hypothetical protein
MPQPPTQPSITTTTDSGLKLNWTKGGGVSLLPTKVEQAIDTPQPKPTQSQSLPPRPPLAAAAAAAPPSMLTGSPEFNPKAGMGPTFSQSGIFAVSTDLGEHKREMEELQVSCSGRSFENRDCATKHATPPSPHSLTHTRTRLLLPPPPLSLRNPIPKKQPQPFLNTCPSSKSRQPAT